MRLVYKTADGMLSLHDNVEGGFFRYATQRDWSIPHYEKMLETNANLISFYSRLCKLTGSRAYLAVAKSAAGYVLSTLSDPEGGFYASQDADREESYYREGLEERAGMEKPRVDRTVYADLNGRMACALADYIVLTEDREAEAQLRKTVSRLTGWFDQKRGMRHCEAGVYGLLADNVSFANALFSAGQASKEEGHKKTALRLADFVAGRFALPEGAFADRIISKSDMGRLRIPLSRPDMNARAARMLLRAFRASSQIKYMNAARSCLECFAGSYGKYGIMAAEYGLAVLELLECERGEK